MTGVYDRKDHLYKKAKEQGYRSRAAYKLLELDKKYKLFHKGDKVVDLGCFPGGWLQVSHEKVGPEGVVVGVDLVPVAPIGITSDSVNIIEGDFSDSSVVEELVQALNGPADLVISDMSPKLSGVRFRDVAASVELVELALSFADSVLRPGGSFIAKVFPGQDTEELIRGMRTKFSRLAREHLDSTRKTSNELYVVGLSKKA